MNGRVYDATIGRFTSADPYIQAPRDSQSYNRYSYVRNNPLRYTDPTGYNWWSDFTKSVRENSLVRKITGAVLMAVGAAISAQNPLLGAALMNFGYSVIKYDPSKPESASNQINFTVQNYTVYDWGGSNSYDEQLTRIAELTSNGSGYDGGYISRRDSGQMVSNDVAFVSGGTPTGAILGGTASTVDGGKSANGAISGAFANMYDSGIVGDLAYTAFTFTNVGSVYDTYSQYMSGDLTGYEAFALGMIGIVPGGSVFAKGYNAGKTFTFMHKMKTNDLMDDADSELESDDLAAGDLLRRQAGRCSGPMIQSQELSRADTKF